jgi:hypothetical protein
MKKILLSLVLFALALQPLVVAAGPVIQDDWSRVKDISLGTVIKVETKSGSKVTGSIGAIANDSLSLNDNGKTRTVSRSDVKKLYRVEPGKKVSGKSIGIWTAIGAGVGAGAGAAVLGSSGGSDETGKVIAPFILVGAGLGALIGFGLGNGTKKTLIYESK